MATSAAGPEATGAVTGAVRLALAAHGVAVGTPVCVALSGGLDSTVLLHALVGLGVAPLRAAHVDHRLQPLSGAWAHHCERLCAGLGVPLAVHRVTVDARGGEGPEGAARRARYAVLAAGLAPGEVLATAHHRDDQAETVLLNLVRGGGVAGLGGVPAAAALGPGRLLRPLLELPRAALAEYARGAALAWVEDPSNADRGLDRNFVRHEVLPLLAQRWPAAPVTLARSGRLCAEAAGLLDELAAQDARRVGRRGRVRVAALAELAPARQRNLLRHLCRLALGSVPSEARLREGLAQLLAAGLDRNPALEWTGGSIRRHRGELHVLPPLPGGAGPAGGKLAATAGASLDLGGLGCLRLVRARGAGLATARLGESLEVRWRRGGERLRPAGDAHTRELKKLLQDRGIVPWMRPHVPLVYAGDALAAVGTLWVADEYAARAGEPGLRLRWERHPPLE